MLTRLAAALVFPCSLFLKSQLAEEPALELSEGTVINLSCSKNKTQYQENSHPYDIYHANSKTHYLTKASIYKSINKGGSKVLSSWINSCTGTSPAIKQVCLRKHKKANKSIWYKFIQTYNENLEHSSLFSFSFSFLSWFLVINDYDSYLSSHIGYQHNA